MSTTCVTSPGVGVVCTTIVESSAPVIPGSETSTSLASLTEPKPTSTPTPSTLLETASPAESPSILLPLSPEAFTPTPAELASEIPPSSSSVSTDVTSITPAALLPQASESAVVSNKSSSSSNGVAPGAVAGIAIATAIIGAAIAFLIAFFVLKRRQKSLDSSSSSVPELVTVGKSGSGPNGPEMTQVASASRSGKGDIDLTNLSNSSDFLASVLPQTADDREVRERVSTLFDQVHLHVENFYLDVHATLTTNMERELGVFLSAESAKLLRGSARPTVVIKHVLMSYVLGITAPEGDTASESDGTLFPRDVAGVGDGNPAHFTPSQGLPAAYILYRRLAAHLYSSSKSSPSAAAARLSEIRGAASHFPLAFFPWANPSYSDRDRDEHLTHVIGNALDLRIWLFGQPFMYEFAWGGDVGSSGVVVAPGLTKVSDARGSIERRKGQVMLGPTVVNV